MKKSAKKKTGPWAANLSKDELEKQKVALEIEQLREPWWKRPGYLAIALPGLLAFATLIVGVSTGFFKNQYDLIQIKNEKAGLEQRLLEQDKQKLNQDKDALGASISELEKRKKTLTEESVANELKFTKEQERLTGELQKINNERLQAFSESQDKRRKLEQEEKDLTKDFETRKNALGDQIAKINEELFVAPFRDRIALLDKGRVRFSETYFGVKKDRKNLPLYLKAAEQSLNDPKMGIHGRAGVLMLLYLFARDGKWLTQFESFMADSIGLPAVNSAENSLGLYGTGNPRKDFEDILGTVAADVSQKDRYQLSERMIAVVYQQSDRLNDIDQAVVLGTIASLLDKERTNHIKSFTNPERFFDILERARDITLREGLTRREGASYALAVLAPEGFLVVAAQLDPLRRSQLMAAPDYDLPPSIEELRKKLNFPPNKDDVAQKRWLNNHGELKSLWLDDPGLQRLRTNPALLNHG